MNSFVMSPIYKFKLLYFTSSIFLTIVTSKDNMSCMNRHKLDFFNNLKI